MHEDLGIHFQVPNQTEAMIRRTREAYANRILISVIIIATFRIGVVAAFSRTLGMV